MHAVGRGAGRLPGRIVECRWKGRGSDGQGLKWHWQDKGGNLGLSPGLPSITFWARKSLHITGRLSSPRVAPGSF